MAFIRGVDPLANFIVTFKDWDFTGIAKAVSNCFKANKSGSYVGVAKEFCDIVKIQADLSATAANAAQKIAPISPFKIEAPIMAIINPKILTPIIGKLTVISGVVGLVSETLALVRQNSTLNAIHSTGTDVPVFSKDRVDQLIKTLEELDQVGEYELLESLPSYLKDKILHDFPPAPDGTLFKNLISSIKEEGSAQSKEIAEKLLNEVTQGVYKKQILHTLNVVACFLGIALGLALTLSCPLLAITLLSAFCTALTVIALITNKGYVENPDEGLNWKLILPDFIKKKLLMDEKEFEQLNAQRTSYYPMQTAPSTLFKVESEIDNNGTKSVNTEASSVAQEKVSFWKELWNKIFL